MPIWGVIPAAGHGARMMSEIPKQYLALHGECMLTRSVRTLVENPAIDGAVVVLAADDEGFATLPESLRSQVTTTTGGATRSESVAAGLRALIDEVGDTADDSAGEEKGSNTWALVHDAARPLLSARDLLNLVSRVTESDAGGGLLAVPVSDTLKRAQEHGDPAGVVDRANAAARTVRVTATLDRRSLWQAQTPQMFRAGELLAAIERAQRDNLELTDEASAMEHAGMTPLLVAAMDPNFKVTRSADLQLAAAWLASRNG